MHKLLMFLVCLLFTGLSVANTTAPLSYEVLAQQTLSPDKLEGEFSQVKYLAVLQAGISSSGHFSYQRDQEILWITDEPVINELIITPGALVSRQDNQEVMRLDMQENPAGAILGDILFAVLTADWSSLEDYFQLSGALFEDDWKAELIPIDILVKQSIVRVELTGDTLVKHIVLHEANGDKTTIEFRKLQF